MKHHHLMPALFGAIMLLGLQLPLNAADTSVKVAVPVWHNRPASLGQAIEQSEVIVIAHVTGVNSGEDIVVPVQGMDIEDRIPTQRISFKTKKIIKGNPGRNFILFRTGSPQFLVEGDPAYTQGETHLLMLVKRDDGTYRIISPEGRYEIKPNGLKPASTQGFAAILEGTSADALTANISHIHQTSTK